MRLQNMSVTSSRALTRRVWTIAASSVSRLASPASPGFFMSAASVSRASPAKCPTLAIGTPASHASVGPIASRSARCFSRALSLPIVAALAGSFSRSNGLRRVAGSATRSRASLALPSAGILDETVLNTPSLTSARTRATIRSSVE